MYAVLANRQWSSQFNELKIADFWRNELESYDVIIGNIADDQMRTSMKDFDKGMITDKVLMAYLESANYGKQYVLKTAYACSKVDILSEKQLYGKELADARLYNDKKKDESDIAIRKLIISHRNDGSYIDEIIEREQNKERAEKKKGAYERG